MPVISSCVICGEKTKVTPFQAGRGRGQTCSIRCRNIFVRSKQDNSGEKNPRWRGGVSKNKDYIRNAKSAHKKVFNAIKKGILKRKPCSRCSTTINVQAHHEDYGKPLDVLWLCGSCHHRHHARQPASTTQHRSQYD